MGTFNAEDSGDESFLLVSCNGNEESLSACSTSTLLLNCPREYSLAGASCIDRQITGCSDGDIRIASDGISEQFGRVEVCSSGVWGTVCDNQWDDNDATVVCRRLGFTDGVATIESAFRLSTLRPAFLNNVGCTGTESSLLACSGAGLEETTCLADEFAGVVCDSEIVERCLDNDNSTDVVTEQFLPNNVFGTCEQLTASELCSTVYDTSTSVFILSERSLSQTRLTTQLNDVVTSIIFEEDACKEPIIRIVCHYFLPPCGSNNVTFPPTTICQEDCRRVQDTCTGDWTIVHDILGATNLGEIDCFATERAVSPLPSCCTSAGVQQISLRMPAHAGVIVSGVLAAVFVILVVLFIIAMVLLVMKLRRNKIAVQSLQRDVFSSPNPEAMAHFQLDTLKESQLNTSPQSKKPEAIPNPYSRHMLSSSTEEVLARSASDASRKILSRYSANFARQMSRHMNITKHQLILEEKIGTGEFGIVYRALLTEHDGERSEVVAVKTLKGLYDHNEIHKIMDESLKMKLFNHPNVLSLIGVCLDTGAAPYIIMPYMANGSLQQYLKKERANLILGENVDEYEVEDVQKRLTVMCLHIAQGMEYLVEQCFIHRDLAARNCMIDGDFVIKIADFGLSEDIYARNYFRQEKDVSIKLPVKWMAPESLNDGIFSEKTDVWSFGVTCWEVFSGGKSPYPGVDPRALCQMLDNGMRLDKPNNAACPDHMFEVMQECWELDSREWPTFSEIVTSVAGFATNLAGYVDFSEFNPFEPSEHSQRPSRTSMASLDSDLVRSKQGRAASFTTADSDVYVKSKASTLLKDRDDHKKKTKSFSSLSDRTKRFLPKKKKVSNPSTTFESALEGAKEEPVELAEGSRGSAGIQINIQPASVDSSHDFFDEY